MDFKCKIMKRKNVVLFLFFLLTLATGCKSPLTGAAGNYVYKTECLGNELDGSIIVKAWGFGKNQKEAFQQAKINAVKDVLFLGIYEGKSDCGHIPLITEVNAYQKNEIYFNDFFSNRGDYSDFVKVESSKKDIVIKLARNGITVGLVVKILKSDLKEKMIKDSNKLKIK
jgi:hypothetical protein